MAVTKTVRHSKMSIRLRLLLVNLSSIPHYDVTDVMIEDCRKKRSWEVRSKLSTRFPSQDFSSAQEHQTTEITLAPSSGQANSSPNPGKRMRLWKHSKRIFLILNPLNPKQLVSWC